jgi:N-acetylmuramoyl-L-alanine amidase
MSERGMTRRSLLSAGAGALAGGLLRRGDALAAIVGPPSPLTARGRAPRVYWRSLGDLAGGGRVASADLRANADLVGLSYRAGAPVRVQLRFRITGGRWSAWVAAGAAGHGPDRRPRSPVTFGEPVWTGGSGVVQVRADGALRDVRIACVDVSAGAGARRLALAGPGALDASLPLATPTLAAGPGQPSILARRAWAQGMAPPRVTPQYGAVRMAFVHHTENPNGYSPGEVPAMLRAIFAFHRYVRGWNDIGYNFVIDLYGRIFEARAGGIDEAVVGAQAGGYNTESTGVAVLGEFMSTPISPAAAGALERLLAWKLSLHGVPSRGRVAVRVDPAGAGYTPFRPGQRVSLPRVAGHRDGDSTDCPGDVLYGQLPELRPRIHSLAGRPAQLTLKLAGQAPATAPAPAPTPGAAPGPELQLAGTLAFLDGAPVPGASVLVQARSVAERGQLVSEQTLARAVTDAGGSWSATVGSTPARGASWLRALCPGGVEGGTGRAGATVSGQLRIAGAVTSAPAAPPTPAAAAPPAS